MSARTKARILSTLVVLLAFWPVVHRQLVTRLDVDPWKLYGFAMYCTPHHVAIHVVDRGGESLRRIAPESFPPELRRRYDYFSARRATLGHLVPPDDLAAGVFLAFPELRSITVAVRIFSIQPFATGITHRTRLYPFERPSSD